MEPIGANRLCSACKLLKRWSGRRGSNPRRPAWEAGILPLNYSRSAGTKNYSKEVLCAPSQNWPAWEANILPPDVPVFILIGETQRIRVAWSEKRRHRTSRFPAVEICDNDFSGRYPLVLK